VRGGLVLGVDGGGSKTHLALASGDGCLRAFINGPGSAMEYKGPKRLAGIFSRLLARACRVAGARPGDIRAACLGLNGIDIARDFRYALECIVAPLGLGCRVKIHNDAFIALFNDRWRERGAVITVGSGHKWLAVNGKREFMHDGLVFQGLRDMAMERLLMAVEGYIKPSSFTDRLLSHCGFSSYRDFLRRWRYGGSRPDYVRPITGWQWERISGVQVWLGREAARGSRDALSLLDSYAASLVLGTEVAVRKAGLGGREFELVMSGSVLAGIPALRAAVRRRLARALPCGRAVRAVFRPVRGALIHAAHTAWGGFAPGALADAELRYPSTG